MKITEKARGYVVDAVIRDKDGTVHEGVIGWAIWELDFGGKKCKGYS